MLGNEGNKWGNNLEVKIPLIAAPIVTDSHLATNYYQIAFKMSPTSSSNYSVYAQTGALNVGAKSFANVNYDSVSVTPKTAPLWKRFRS